MADEDLVLGLGVEGVEKEYIERGRRWSGGDVGDSSGRHRGHGGLRDGGGCACGVFFEEVDGLGLAVFVDGEVGLRQVGDGIAVFLVDDHIDENLAGGGAEDGNVSGVGGVLGRVRGRQIRRRSLCDGGGWWCGVGSVGRGLAVRAGVPAREDSTNPQRRWWRTQPGNCFAEATSPGLAAREEAFASSVCFDPFPFGVGAGWLSSLAASLSVSTVASERKT